MIQNNKNFKKIKTVASVAVMVATLGGLGIGPIVAHAANTQTPKGQTTKDIRGTKNKAVSHTTMGTVSVINGNTITLIKTGKNSTTTTYTVDATSAKIYKKTGKGSPTLITIADIKLADKLTVKGTLNGTTINATSITDAINTLKTTKK